MAKLSKNLLKEIVKECLIELLSEGISNGDSSSLTESLNAKTRKIDTNNTTRQHSVKKKNIDRMLPKENSIKNENFERKTQEVINNATKDPIMAELLADTAQTTLQEQNSADQPNKFTARGHDNASKIVESSDPTELFGGASNNWAHLAFFDDNN